MDDLFKDFGVISQSRVYGDGVGFVRFEQNDEATQAIEKMNGARPDPRCTENLLVKRAFKKTRNPKRFIRVGDEVREVEMIMNKNTNNVYLRCLPKGFTEQDLIALCSPHGDLTCTRLRESGVAFVRYRLATDAQRAIRNLNGHTFPDQKERLLAKLANSDPFQPKIGFRQRQFEEQQMVAAAVAEQQKQQQQKAKNKHNNTMSIPNSDYSGHGHNTHGNQTYNNRLQQMMSRQNNLNNNQNNNNIYSNGVNSMNQQNQHPIIYDNQGNVYENVGYHNNNQMQQQTPYYQVWDQNGNMQQILTTNNQQQHIPSVGIPVSIPQAQMMQLNIPGYSTNNQQSNQYHGNTNAIIISQPTPGNNNNNSNNSNNNNSNNNNNNKNNDNNNNNSTAGQQNTPKQTSTQPKINLPIGNITPNPNPGGAITPYSWVNQPNGGTNWGGLTPLNGAQPLTMNKVAISPPHNPILGWNNAANNNKSNDNNNNNNNGQITTKNITKISDDNKDNNKDGNNNDNDDEKDKSPSKLVPPKIDIKNNNNIASNIMNTPSQTKVNFGKLPYSPNPQSIPFLNNTPKFIADKQHDLSLGYPFTGTGGSSISFNQNGKQKNIASITTPATDTPNPNNNNPNVTPTISSILGSNLLPTLQPNLNLKTGSTTSNNAWGTKPIAPTFPLTASITTPNGNTNQTNNNNNNNTSTAPSQTNNTSNNNNNNTTPVISSIVNNNDIKTAKLGIAVKIPNKGDKPDDKESELSFKDHGINIASLINIKDLTTPVGVPTKTTDNNNNNNNTTNQATTTTTNNNSNNNNNSTTNPVNNPTTPIITHSSAPQKNKANPHGVPKDITTKIWEKNKIK